MRAVPAVTLIIVASLLLAGCLQLPDPDEPEGPKDGGTGQADPSDDQNIQDEDDPNGENSTDGPDNEDEPDEGDPDEDGPDEPACDEQEQTNGHYPPAPPKEQEVERLEEVRCPGHYVVTDEGSGDAWQVPTWQTGDWWIYQRDQFNETAGYSCHQKFHETVNGTGESWEIPVYHVDLRWYDCDENPERTYAQNRTQSSLSEFSDHRWGEGKDSGYVNHFIHFPLRDDKKWSFMNAPGHVVESRVSHQPDFLFQGQTVEAWKVESTIKNVELTHWFGVDEKNLLREERRMTGFLFDYTILVDSGSGP